MPLLLALGHPGSSLLPYLLPGLLPEGLFVFLFLLPFREPVVSALAHGSQPLLLFFLRVRWDAISFLYFLQLLLCHCCTRHSASPFPRLLLPFFEASPFFRVLFPPFIIPLPGTTIIFFIPVLPALAWALIFFVVPVWFWYQSSLCHHCHLPSSSSSQLSGGSALSFFIHLPWLWLLLLEGLSQSGEEELSAIFCSFAKLALTQG